MKKYYKHVLWVLLAVLVAPGLSSCSDDDEDVTTTTTTPPKYEAVSGKYEITNSSAPYESIELGASGDYIVTRRNAGYATYAAHRNVLASLDKASTSRATSYDNLIYGTYTQIEDATFNLEGFGTVQLKSDRGQGLTEIVIKPNGGSEMTFTAQKAATMGDDDLTNAICRTWKVVKVHEKGYDSYDGEYDETYTPEQKSGALSEVMFTKSGTFLNFFTDNEIETHFWKWENQSALQIRYSWDNVWYNDDDEGTVSVSFTPDNHLTIYEYYMDYESGEWFESTVELVEKYPTDSGNTGEDENQGGTNVPTGESPVAKVFTGKLVDEVDDHGLDKFVYENGFLTRVLSDDDGGYTITFAYNYLTPDADDSLPDVQYTRTNADGSVEFAYDVYLNAAGFAETIDSRHYEDGELSFSFQSTCDYDAEGHLVSMYEGREERTHTLTWTNGDLVSVDIQGRSLWTTNFTYSEALNSNDLMFFYDVYDMDIEELKYLYWAGLLGIAPKHLVATSTETSENGEYYQFEWQADKVLSRPDSTSPWEEIIHFSFAE